MSLLPARWRALLAERSDALLLGASGRELVLYWRDLAPKETIEVLKISYEGAGG